MKEHLESLLRNAIKNLQTQGKIASDLEITIHIERARDKQFGDFASNIAMLLAKPAKCKPRELATMIVDQLPKSELVNETLIAGPGFINFFVAAAAFHRVIHHVLADTINYGTSKYGAGKKIHIEFVSANPTSPLHVAHGRGAAYGATVADLLAAVGFQVHREYYVNDSGRQLDILAISIWLRYLEALGEKITFPNNGYHGDYIRAIAVELLRTQAELFKRDIHLVFQDIAADSEKDDESDIDTLIRNSKNLLATDYKILFAAGIKAILEDIKNDLAEFGIHYQEWFSEEKLKTSGAIASAIDKLRASGTLYEKEGALWFNSTAFGDDKDRVLVRANGETTYFAADVAYHLDKFNRGYDEIIDILGADHHGYTARIRAALQAAGHAPEKLQALVVQFAILYRGEERISMSNRSSSFVTLRELREEVGNDAARFFYIYRKSDHHMDFDLELAKSQSNDNPIYYIQYAHARICGVFNQLKEKNLIWDKETGFIALNLLTTEQEKCLLADISRYKEVLLNAAIAYEPHQLANFLRELAHDFHTYYNAHQFIVENAGLRNARLNLIAAVRQLLANGLKLLGVSALEAM